MKLKVTFLLLLLCLFVNGFSQIITGYIAVRPRYTDTRLVDNSPYPPSRQNRLVLSFYDVSNTFVYTPASPVNYDVYVFESGIMSGGGNYDSANANYPGYAYTAPIISSYHSSMGQQYWDCNPNLGTHYVVNSHELDCGWVTVSYWTEDPMHGTPVEFFNAPTLGLILYPWTHPYAFVPGNINFYGYLWHGYNFSCGGNLQYATFGIPDHDTASIFVSLPVNFANIHGEISATDMATISFSNLTETNIDRYEVERSVDGIVFTTTGSIAARSNNGDREDYAITRLQPDVVNYYRVKAVETNGTFFYSTVISLTKRIRLSSFTAYPNPVTNGLLSLRLSNAASGRYILSVISSSHQYLRQKLINHSSGDLTYQYDLTGLPSSVYQLVLQSTTQRYSQTIIYVY